MGKMAGQQEKRLGKLTGKLKAAKLFSPFNSLNDTFH
jgi:hypothetical protein